MTKLDLDKKVKEWDKIPRNSVPKTKLEVTKLKTLKDIDEYSFALERLKSPQQFKRELKAEAIKWIKMLEDTSECPVINKGLVLWIKDFFNIEEELK